MNNLLDKTYQIDTVIQRIQKQLYDGLIEVWDTERLDGYGRVYKNEKEGKTIPEIYDAYSKKYKEVLYDNQSCFFFVDEDNHPTEDEFEFNPSVKIVFMVNLDDLKGSDSSIQTDVVSLIRNINDGFTISGLEKGLNTVFRGFDIQSIKWNDMQPLHVFAVAGELNYSINDKCS